MAAPDQGKTVRNQAAPKVPDRSARSILPYKKALFMPGVTPSEAREGKRPSTLCYAIVKFGSTARCFEPVAFEAGCETTRLVGLCDAKQDRRSTGRLLQCSPQVSSINRPKAGSLYTSTRIIHARWSPEKCVPARIAVAKPKPGVGSSLAQHGAYAGPAIVLTQGYVHAIFAPVTDEPRTAPSDCPRAAHAQPESNQARWKIENSMK
jgi:hypothetical protein